MAIQGPLTLFFSWQADTPTDQGRAFLESALKQALEIIAGDTTLEESIREGISIDSDTKGVGGQPPIVDTVFRKIDSAAVFVPDLTFVGQRIDGRPTPNPNVLIEYGWALKSLGHGRILPVMNVAFGKPTAETMPFDMGHLRFPLTYALAAKSGDAARVEELQRFSNELVQQIRLILNNTGVRSPASPTAIPFPEVEPKDGPGKFRKKGEPLGISDGFLGRDKAYVLQDGPSVWLRVMPAFDDGRRLAIMDLAKNAKDSKNLLLPLLRTYSGYDFLRAADGFGTCAVLSNDRTETTSVVLVFQSGEVWSVDTYLLSAGNGVPFLEPIFKAALGSYVRFLQGLKFSGPYRWIAGINGVTGKGLYYPPPPGQSFMLPGPYGKCLVDVVSDAGSMRPDEKPVDVLRPFFRRVFDSFGRERPEYMDTATD